MPTLVLLLALLGQQKYTCGFHIYVETEGRASQTVATPSRSDVGFLDAVEKACKGFRDGPDKKGVANVDLVCKGERSRYHVWGKGNSLHEAIDDAVRLAREDLKK